MEQYNSESCERVLPRFNNVVDKNFIVFQGWKIATTKSHILKSICPKNDECKEGEPDCCEVCV